MPRKPSDVTQIKIRVREDLRRRLEQAAKKRDVSVNFEMVDRLKASFDQTAHRTIDEAAASIKLVAERFEHYARETVDRNLLDDLREAGAALVAQIEQQPAEIRARKELKDTVEWMRTAIAAVEHRYGRPLPHWEK